MKKYLLFIALLISTGLFAQQSGKKDIHIKIIQTTDVHGCVFPQDLVNQRTRRGSLAQVQTYVKEQRADKNQSVVLLDNGDILQGTPFVYYYNYVDTKVTHKLALVMNYMKYDAGTVETTTLNPGMPCTTVSGKKLISPGWRPMRLTTKPESPISNLMSSSSVRA